MPENYAIHDGTRPLRSAVVTVTTASTSLYDLLITAGVTSAQMDGCQWVFLTMASAIIKTFTITAVNSYPSINTPFTIPTNKAGLANIKLIVPSGGTTVAVLVDWGG